MYNLRLFQARHFFFRVLKTFLQRNAAVAQLVEQWIENPRVMSSILIGGTMKVLLREGFFFVGAVFGDDTVGMNPPLRFLVALLIGVTASLSAESANQWQLFQSLDWSGRLAYLEKGAPADWDEDFLVKVLDLTDGARIESGTDTEVSLKKAITLKVVRAAADKPAPSAIPRISRLPVQYRDPVLRGEAWAALAKLGDRTVIPSLVRNLAALNESGQRGRAEEIQASYAVQALGMLKATEGFRAVAQATQAWYTPASGVRTLAQRALPMVATDLDAEINKLLATDEDLRLVEGMFQYVTDQGDPVRSARAAASLLGPLVRLIPHDKEDQDRTYRLILAGLSAAQKAPAPPASLVPSLKVLLTKNDNTQQMTQAIQLLARIDDPSALAVLVDQMRRYNEQQKAGGNTTRDLALVKETIVALGLTGKAGARAPLDEARFSDYTPAFTRDASDAMAKLPRE